MTGAEKTPKNTDTYYEGFFTDTQKKNATNNIIVQRDSHTFTYGFVVVHYGVT